MNAVKKLKEPRLNVQGLARKEKGLMSCLLPDEGFKVIGCDLVAAEPTVTCHFSGDPMYRYACFDGVGIAPFYNERGVLMIDDIYLMLMSVSPVGAKQMLEAYNTTWNGKSFADQWLADSEVIKKGLKQYRHINKILALGFSYSLGPKKAKDHAYENGYDISLLEATTLFKTYWSLFSKVKQLGDKLQSAYHKRGYILNPFGYRLVPDKDYKSLNYFIQSSISGLMHALCGKFFASTPYAELNTIIHDEIVMDIPTDKLAEAEWNMKLSVRSINEELNWSVPIRTGWVVGDNWYAAK